MRTFIFAAGILALSTTAVLAGSEQYPGDLPTRPITSSQILSQTGSEAFPMSGAPVAVIAAAPDLLPSAAEGAIETANSLPKDALEGTEFYAVAAARSRYLAQIGQADGYALAGNNLAVQDGSGQSATAALDHDGG